MASRSRKVIKKVQVTATIDTSAFTTGDAMHTDAIEIPGALQHNGSGRVVGALVSDLDNVSPDMDIVLFSSEPTASTITANAAFDCGDSDLLNIQGVIELVASDFKSFADNSVAHKAVDIPVDKGTIDASGAGSRSIWAVLVARDSSNFSTATALTINISVEQD